MDIHEATRSYEDWMRGCTTIVEPHLRFKHRQMREDPFLFFRGTFYRWAQLWPKVCANLSDAPKVMCVGDLHVGSFGTWRDSEGRLCWGVTDFDESHPFAYTNDLVRLASSVKMQIDSEGLGIKLRDACDAILAGYQESIKKAGCPLVLAEHESNLEKVGIAELKTPQDFWEKLNQHRTIQNRIPREAKHALEEMLPERNLQYRIIQREAGVGSLGQQRFVAIAMWRGGFIAREAKAMVPSAFVWLNGHSSRRQSDYQKVLERAVRCHDPYQKIVGSWLIRRLSPDSNTIHVDDWPAKRDDEALLHAMGSEAANVHLGGKPSVRLLLRDLRRRKANWLRSAAKEMAKLMEREWKNYWKS